MGDGGCCMQIAWNCSERRAPACTGAMLESLVPSAPGMNSCLATLDLHYDIQCAYGRHRCQCSHVPKTKKSWRQDIEVLACMAVGRNSIVWPETNKKRTIGLVGATMVGRCFSGSSIQSIHFSRALHVKRSCTKKIWIRSCTLKRCMMHPPRRAYRKPVHPNCPARNG